MGGKPERAYLSRQIGAVWCRISHVSACSKKLSNSGDTLKLLVLSHIWKYMSGWINYSGIVTSQMMHDKEMGYRGSKSNKGNTLFVKEQRVDGSCIETTCTEKKVSMLRCTLMGFEKSYQIRVLSKVLDKKEIRYYSTQDNLRIIQRENSSLDPWFLTGFIDGEGCFRIPITKIDRAIGWRVQLFFQITLHEKDKILLENIKNCLSVGKIHKSGKNLLQYRIQTFDELTVLLDHLENYPLISQKKADYELFRKAYGLVRIKEHLNKEGIAKIVSIKASLNLGLSNELEKAFPGVIPVERPKVFFSGIPNNNWLAGFASAEGCFLIGITNSSAYSTGYQVYLVFIITQHIRDELLMKSLIDYLGCGRLSRKRDIYEFQVSKFSDIRDKVLVFFEKYPILGEKAKDYVDFCKAVDMMKSKFHLTKEGVAKIQELKAGMNRGR
jgi:hypothetical protein